MRPRPPAGATVVLVRGGAELARWALPDGRRPDLSVVDDLARLQLAARRLGCSIVVRAAGAELSRLVDLVGLGRVVPCAGGSVVEVGGEAEGGEEAGIEKVVVSDDPVA